MRTIIIAIVCLSVFAASSFACPRPENPYLGDSGYCKNPDCRCILNMQDSHGRTLLHEMAEYGRVEMVRWLLRLGADWTVLDNRDRLPFELAYDLREGLYKLNLKLGRGYWVFLHKVIYIREISEQYEQIMEALFDQGAGKGAYKELFEGYFERDCRPEPETCNCVDDDCNGVTDDGCGCSR